jgi:hypothetical protein
MVPRMEYFSQMNLRAASLALLLFLFPIIALSFFSVRYSETIHRVTMSQLFDSSLFGSIEADSLAAIGLGLLFLGISSRYTAPRVIFATIFAVASGAFLAGWSALIIGALAIVPAIGALLIMAAVADRQKPLENNVKRLPLDGKRVAGAFLFIIIVIEVGALARWIAYPATGGEIYSDPTWRLAELESGLFHSLGLLSPLLVVLLAFSFLYRWYILDVFRRAAQALFPQNKITKVKQSNNSTTPQDPRDLRRKIEVERRLGSGSSSLVVTYAESNTLTSRRLHWGLLTLALVAAPLLMVYPHLPMINPNGEGISTDEQYYLRWLTQFRDSVESGGANLSNIISTAFTINNGGRPLTLLLLLGLSNLTGIPDLLIIRFLPVALAPSLVAANYFLLRHAFDAKKYGIERIKVFSSIGAALAAFSPQVIVGEYAGLLANWIALIVAYFALYLAIRCWESVERRKMVMAFLGLFAVLAVTMLFHVYTWAHLLAVIMIFAGLSFVIFRKSVYQPKAKLILLAITVLGSFALDYTRSLYFETPSAAEPDSALASNIQANDPAGRWERL